MAPPGQETVIGNNVFSSHIDALLDQIPKKVKDSNKDTRF